MDSVNSTTFIKRPPFMTEVQECFLYTKEVLRGKIFLGYYQERRFVPVLNEYRDIVVISSEEKDLHSEIIKIQKKLLPVSGVKWVGITGPESLYVPDTYCFWVKLVNLPFGYYWFQIKNVKLEENEILLQLKHIRKSQTSDCAFFSHHSQSNIENNKNEMSDSSELEKPILENFNQHVDLKKTFSKISRTCNDVIKANQHLITWENVFNVLKVGCGLIIALILASISCVRYLGEFVLRVLHELTLLVDALSPIIIQLIDFFTKVIGGLFILIAGMFQRNANRQVSEVYRNNQLRRIPYLDLKKTPDQVVDWRVRNNALRQELFFKRRQ